ncbi:MAG: hypothetical protein Q4E21_08820 [Clostridia bacterium]|nr:hypothetical protein [Clostridia bacterium]
MKQKTKTQTRKSCAFFAPDGKPKFMFAFAKSRLKGTGTAIKASHTEPMLQQYGSFPIQTAKAE